MSAGRLWTQQTRNIDSSIDYMLDVKRTAVLLYEWSPSLIIL